MLSVRGRPFLGINPSRYVWAEPPLQEMVSSITDAAVMAAEIRMAKGDYERAREVVTRALSVDWSNDRLVEIAIQACQRGGDAETAARLVERHERLLDELATRSGGHQDIAEEPGAQVDRATELQKQWGTELGQLWEIPGKAGVHRVLCGDSTKEADVGRVTGGQKPFIMVTDPPYGVGYEPGWRDGIVGEFGAAARVKDAVANDDTVDWSSAYRLFPGDVAYTWSPGGDHVLETGRAIQEAGFQIRSMLVWRKQHFAISRGHYHWQHEPCWYAVRKGKAARWCGDRTQSSIWDIASLNPAGRQEERLQHGTQKPLECMARPIRNHGAEGDVVYDPFLGSGTTIVACEQLGRIGYGIEIEPKYVAVTLQRLKDVGLQPRLSKTKTRKATKKTARKRS